MYFAIRSIILAVCMAVVLTILANTQQAPVECGPKNVKIKVQTHRDIHPLPQPSPGKALIYIFETFGMFRSGRVAVNGRWVADTNNYTYTFFEAEPGLLKFCSAVGGVFAPRFIYLTVEAGKTYYVENGTDKRGGAIYETEEAAARKWLEQCKYITVTMEEKK